jgi:hypothetical protein
MKNSHLKRKTKLEVLHEELIPEIVQILIEKHTNCAFSFIMII